MALAGLEPVARANNDAVSVANFHPLQPNAEIDEVRVMQIAEEGVCKPATDDDRIWLYKVGDDYFI